MRITSKLLALRIVALAAALFGAALGVTSCQQLLGDVQLVDKSVASLDRDGGISVPPLDECVLGTFRCNGSKREICADMIDGGARWMTQEDCLSTALCEQGLTQTVIGCPHPACGSDDARCDGATPKRCNEDFTDFEAFGLSCDNAGQCSTLGTDCAGGAPCCTQGCTRGTIRCNAGAMERCSDDQEAFELVEQCASAELCQQGLDGCGGSAGACACGVPVCQPGKTRCSPDTAAAPGVIPPTKLEVCNAGQTGWQFVDMCANDALCELGRTRSPLSCEPPKCSTESDEHRCTEEGVLRRCRENRTDFDDEEACPGGAAFCNAGAHSCAPVPCGPGDLRCNGATIETCRADRGGFDPTDEVCASAALCSRTGGVHCDPPVCAADAFECVGGIQLQRCNDSRDGFINVGAACIRAELCSADRRRCDVCVPNRRECTLDLQSSHTCNAGGTAFGPSTNCPLGCVAESGACNTCTVGAFSCQAGTLMRCNDGRSTAPVAGNVTCNGNDRLSCQPGQTGPAQAQTCANGCNAQRLACNECTGQQRRCAGGTTFQQCRANGTFAGAASCDTGLACEGAGLCRCSAGARRCDDLDLLVCSLDRTQFNLADRCDSAAACAAATGNTCPDCIQDGCFNGQPFSCEQGQRVAGGACGPGLSCVGAGLCRCRGGDTRCNAGQLQECNGPGTGFVAADACNGSELRLCNGGATPDTEDCGTAALCAASSPNGCAQCLTTDTFSCPGGQICAGDPQVCQPAPP